MGPPPAHGPSNQGGVSSLLRIEVCPAERARCLYSESALIFISEFDCFAGFVDRQAFLREGDQHITIFEKRPSIKPSIRRFAHHAIRIAEEAHGLPLDTRHFEFCCR